MRPNTDLKYSTLRKITTVQDIWEKTLRHIRKHVTAENYSTYFRPLTYEGIENNVCRISVDDDFFGDWIRDHYSELLATSIESVTGSKTSINITTKKRQPSRPTRQKTSNPIRRAIKRTNKKTVVNAPTFQSNPNYCFDNFIIGPSNELAHAAFMASANQPGLNYNPLFVYGSTGLGKTHLLFALGKSIQEENPDARIVYVSAEDFTNQVISHIRNKKMDEFRERYRTNCDVLLIDDVHVLGGKERTQEEFFHTFNTLHQQGKQIVLTSDRTPDELSGFEARLRSRFQWGLICDIQPPALETRVAILETKALERHIQLPHDVAFCIAENVNDNIRQLEGALVRLLAYATLKKEALTKTLVHRVLGGTFQQNTQAPSVESIIEVVAKQYGIDINDITGKRRLRKFAHPRSLAMYLCRKYTQASFPMIGENFGGKDHSTVVAACKKVEKAYREDHNLAQELKTLEGKLPKYGR